MISSQRTERQWLPKNLLAEAVNVSNTEGDRRLFGRRSALKSKSVRGDLIVTSDSKKRISMEKKRKRNCAEGGCGSE